MNDESTITALSPDPITPPRCHWCGGETAVGIDTDGNRSVVCRSCKACGPDCSTPALAVAAYKTVAPTLGKTHGTPRRPGWYVRCDHNWRPIEMLRFDPTPGVVFLEDGARAYYRYLGPIPEPIDESEAAK